MNKNSSDRQQQGYYTIAFQGIKRKSFCLFKEKIRNLGFANITRLGIITLMWFSDFDILFIYVPSQQCC